MTESLAGRGLAPYRKAIIGAVAGFVSSWFLTKGINLEEPVTAVVTGFFVYLIPNN